MSQCHKTWRRGALKPRPCLQHHVTDTHTVTIYSFINMSNCVPWRKPFVVLCQCELRLRVDTLTPRPVLPISSVVVRPWQTWHPANSKGVIFMRSSSCVTLQPSVVRPFPPTVHAQTAPCIYAGCGCTACPTRWPTLRHNFAAVRGSVRVRSSSRG